MLCQAWIANWMFYLRHSEKNKGVNSEKTVTFSRNRRSLFMHKLRGAGGRKLKGLTLLLSKMNLFSLIFIFSKLLELQQLNLAVLFLRTGNFEKN